jgi:sugar O-acyltransferase (sialic acid O-acetyltransferase NeuD family)
MTAPPWEELYIVGAGGHATELHSYLLDLQHAGWPGKLRGCLDDNVPPGTYGRLEVLGTTESLQVTPGVTSYYLTAVGSNEIRRKLVERLTTLYGGALRPWTLRHCQAAIGEDVDIGPGTCLAPGVIVTAKTRIGSHCILNVKASVSHDCSIGDFTNINPGATVCGTVSVGEGAYIGAGAVVKEKISIGAWSTIGAGAVVVRDVPPNVTVAGVPARIIRQA